MQQLSFTRGAPAGSAPWRGEQQAPRSIQFTVPWQSTDQKQRSSSRGPSLSSYAGPKKVQPRQRTQTKPPPRKRAVTRPSWNDDVKQGVYFDQALAKTKLFNAPKKYRDMVEHKPPISQTSQRQLTKRYAPAAQKPTARTRPRSVPPAPSRTVSSLVPRISVKPPVITVDSNKPKAAASSTTATPSVRPSSAASASSSKAQPHSGPPQPQHSPPSPKASLSFALQESAMHPHKSSPRTPSSPVVRSANQEDKDDHEAFPSFPPPPHVHQAPRREPPTLNLHLIESTFRVIDIKRKGKLHAREIHQGLQLLGIATTLRQIADYLYLVNDGQDDTIDIHDWTTLVQTLHSSAWVASSPPTESSYPVELLPPPALPRPAPPAIATSPLDRSHRDFESVATQSSPVHPMAMTSQTPPAPFFVPQVAAMPPTSTSFQETWFIDQIERRIQDMFGRAEAAVALRWNNQQADADPPRDFLRRAASVVHGLKSSLYPLVHQAEETLRAIHERHAGNLSVFLSPKDLAIVADHAEDFCDLLLDDLLLDAAVELTETEQQKARHVSLQSHDQHVQQLVAMIEDIQATERAMADALSRSSSTKDGDVVDVARCSVPLSTLGHLRDATASMAPIELEKVAPQPPPIHAEALQAFPSPKLAICTSNVAKIQDNLELHRQAFARSRRIAEASLVDTGLDQAVVIELLEGMLVDDLMDDLAVELDSCFHTLGDKIVHTA